MVPEFHTGFLNLLKDLSEYRIIKLIT